MDSLKKAREIINRVDREMAKLFVERMEAAQLVAAYKKERGLPVLDTLREIEVIEKNSESIENNEIRPYYVTFLKNTMAVSRAYQDRILEGMKVAYAGCEGAFAHLATERLFPTARKIGYGDFAAAYRAVECGECDIAVLPTENSYNGEVGAVTDLMFQGSLYVNGILELGITQDLLGLPGATLSDIKCVVSHPQAIGQCARFLEEHGLQTMEYANTALAAKYVKETGDKALAAIASEGAAERFGLSVLRRNINSASSNTTRFAVFSRTKNHVSRNAMGIHSILLFTARNEAGSLARAIEIIGKHGYNMRTLRSRPMKELLWQYYFYVEIEGNIDTEDGRSMQNELSAFCDRIKFLGTYQH